MSKIHQFLRNAFRKRQWKSRQRYFRKRYYPTLRNSPTFFTTSIICSNCWGGMLYHDANLKFLSPTINLAFDPRDFIYLVQHLADLPQATMTEDTSAGKSYPVGQLIFPNGEAIEVGFVHCKDFREGQAKFWERASRITEDIVVIFMTSHLTQKIYDDFLTIKYPKVCVYGSTDAMIDPQFSSEFLHYPQLNTSKKDVLSFKRLFGRQIIIDDLGFDWYSFAFGEK